MSGRELVLADELALSAAGEDFTPWLANQRSKETTRAYQHDWRQFQEWCATQGITQIAGVTMSTLVSYRNYLKDELKMKPATIARKLSTIRQAMTFAELAGMITRNPAKLVKSYHVPNVSPRTALANTQARALLAQPNRQTVLGARDYAILMIGLHLGLRRSEIASLTRGSISQERGHQTILVNGKGDKSRLLPAPPAVIEAIRDYVAMDGRTLTANPDAPIFLATRQNRHHRDKNQGIPSQVIWFRVKHYAKMAGITDHAHLDAHTLRGTAITNALDNGAAPRRVQAMAGHADPKTTMRYDSRRADLDHSAVYHVHYDG